ncbi:hypothetical protein BDN70DRAFT_805798 [Pholiota conissans]|uniref:Ribosomal protein S21 n=1 Tax=Pholiota conissans TaxID=109636 RepID=A0A9P6CUZ9_9AGAR|nr:hypothetical protein BDN70DRAFT_805798 [Pholiota conissans]
MATAPPPKSQHVGAAVAEKATSHVAQYSPDEKWAERSRKAMQDAITNPPADAYAGRSVKNTGNLAIAFRSLNEILVRNKVRQTVRMTERHEKKGTKRRRLQSERWRKQFSNEVRKKVQLVIKIRNRGA